MDRGRRPSRRDETLFNLLARIDELEALREQLDELGVSTRDELEDRIAALEEEAARLESDAKRG